MTDELHRTFPFRVRPRYRETVDSLTRRVLAINGEPADLPTRVLTTHGLTADQWPTLLHKKNRSRPYDAVNAGVHHHDGQMCAQCTDLLPHRWMCTLCAGGDHVEQAPHFTSPVCFRHRRWLGFTETPERQHTTSAEHVRAARRFDKLRQAARVDPRLFGLVSGHLTDELQASEEDVFPTSIALIHQLTHPDFLRKMLDPRQTYRRGYLRLQAAVTSHAGRRLPGTTRALWLLMRPAFAAARTAARTGQPFASGHPHDFPVHPAAVRALPHMRDREPFTRFLEQTGDTPSSANTYLGAAYQRLAPGTRSRHHVCRHGHTFTHTSADLEPRCPRCPRAGAAIPGVNDIASQAPRLVKQWDWQRNGALSPTMVATSSHDKLHWLCKKQHPFSATPSNRTQNDQGCPVCQNRRVLAGANDFATRFPRAFAELSPSAVHRYNPYVHTPSSDVCTRWTCAAGHEFPATFKQRATGYTCPQCRRLASVALRGSLAEKHPAIAAQWVDTGTGRTAHDYSPGSKKPGRWRCERGHEYDMPIERRVAGCGCPYCAGRRLLPGFNDLAATHPRIAAEWHPYLNWTTPDQVFPGSNKKWHWLCPNGHRVYRSAAHRILSGGCAECPREERALHRRS
ncbi:zinc-ribbon domain-containing protein [Microbacterium horticulturae]|uniref:Zinc-ribbon domain-containing protein n=1 Tax=Microbacterium horticulturae TaxID=3028316 RepID=A0ABY8BXN6_9MICO|nr:zinc-ribbon domain-containing protein [Microbacterium sp. KACC 23027]WEG08645.1 zinc-ribbon domain-containing protein [Microbacterium sp. KACC 23027]